jgi:hypothetical protein
VNRLCNRNVIPESRLQERKDRVVILGYPCLCFVSLLLSMCFEIAEKQLIVISLITGIRWVLMGRNSEVKILIVERS